MNMKELRSWIQRELERPVSDTEEDIAGYFIEGYEEALRMVLESTTEKSVYDETIVIKFLREGVTVTFDEVDLKSDTPARDLTRQEHHDVRAMDNHEEVFNWFFNHGGHSVVSMPRIRRKYEPVGSPHSNFELLETETITLVCESCSPNFNVPGGWMYEKDNHVELTR